MKQILSLLIVATFFLASCKKEKKSDIVKEEHTKEITKSKETLKAESTHWTPRTKEEMVSMFKIEIFDNEALNVIDPNSKIEILASGFTWTEGPVWIKDGNYLLFSDIPNNKVYKLNAQRDTITYLHPSGISVDNFTGSESGSNGLLVDGEGALVLMQQGSRMVGKMKAPLSNPKPEYESLVNNYKGKKLNSPNDGAFDKTGNLYFTDPPYGLPLNLEDPTKELDFQGVYCLLTTGELLLLDATLKYPNGLCVSPDNSKLYVAVSNIENAAWYVYDIVEPGKVANKKVFYDANHFLQKEGYQGLPDGLKIAKNNYMFATGPKGVLIFNLKGKLLARIHTGQLTANCALGKEEKTLYMTAHNFILSVNLK
ncbi:SMP-30/gluconolactonase/LRE family protein [Flavivirga algicola]|nr:SMP-30/gluconolactonase/LRE family protein [Flavivirga algicola]